MSNRGQYIRLMVVGVWAVSLALPGLAVSTNRSPVRPPVKAANADLKSKSSPSALITNNQAPVITPAFDRYAIILARMPFGNEAAYAAAAAAQAAAAAKAAPVESFARNLKMCAITRNHFTGRIQVGLVDAATKKTYFMYEGDKEDDMELVVADYENEKALLKKGTEEVWMDMNAPATAVAAVVPALPVAMAARRGKAEPPPPPPKPLLTGAALEKHLKNYQMDLIRAGGEKGPPLPMELTPEMDDQLVKEGVLAPVE